jgi:hypothetical protein
MFLDCVPQVYLKVHRWGQGQLEELHGTCYRCLTDDLYTDVRSKGILIIACRSIYVLRSAVFSCGQSGKSN